MKRAWLWRVATGSALVAIVVLSIVQRWRVLAASPFPLGVDGYFYPVQVRALLETGGLQYPASPLAFWLIAPLAAATDPITGTKLAAALYGALVALPAYAVGVRLGGGRLAGLVAAALATFSAGSAYLTIEFVKNGIGITVALAALWLVLRALERRTRPRALAAVAGLAAAVLAHKMAAGLVVAIALPAAIAEAVAHGRLRGRRLLELVGALGVAVVALAIAGLVAPQRFLSPDDARLAGELFTSDADWTLPVLASDAGSLRLAYEPVVAAVLAVLAGALLAGERWLGREDRPPPAVVATSIVAVALALVLGIPWLAVDDPQALGMRLRIVAFVPMALSAATIVRVLGRLVAPHRWIAHVLAGVALAAIAIVRVPAARTEGRVLVHPALVTAAHALAGRIPAGDTAIVPERHIAFMIAWYARVPVSIRPEPIPIEHRWRVLPLAFIGMGSALDDALLAVRARTDLPPVVGLHPRHPNGLVLVPEATWQAVLQHLPAADREHFAAWPTL